MTAITACVYACLCAWVEIRNTTAVVLVTGISSGSFRSSPPRSSCVFGRPWSWHCFVYFLSLCGFLGVICPWLFACLYSMLCTHSFSYFFFTCLFPYSSFLLRIDTLPFQTECGKRQLNLPLVFLCLFCVVVPSVLWRCWLGGRKSIWSVKNSVVGCLHG